MVVISDNPYNMPNEKLINIKVEQLYLAGKPYESCRENIIQAAFRGMTSTAKA